MIGQLREIGLGDSRLTSIAALVGAELAQEADTGFPTLSRIPCTGIVKFLDHFATLSPADRIALLDHRGSRR